MTVKFATHSLKTDDITVMGDVTDVATVTGKTISRIGAIEGHEQQNPATIHVNLAIKSEAGGSDMLVLILSPQTAVELGLQLVAMGTDGTEASNILAIKERLDQFLSEREQTLQTSHT